MEDHLWGSQIQCDVIANGLFERGHDVTYIAIDKIKQKYNTDYSVVGVTRDSNDVSSKILDVNPDILYWRFNKRFFYKVIFKIRNAGIKTIFAVSNIKDLKPYGEPILKRITVNNI